MEVKKQDRAQVLTGGCLTFLRKLPTSVTESVTASVGHEGIFDTNKSDREEGREAGPSDPSRMWEFLGMVHPLSVGEGKQQEINRLWGPMLGQRTLRLLQ